MSDPHPTSDRADVLRRAYVEVRKLRARVEELESARTEPIAIIGMACRFPGGINDPAAFWDLLREGRDAITEIPPERWNADAFYDPDPQAVRKMSTRYGGFLDGIDRFEPQFFGITPREAANMDPQQRLLLETAWEALEDAAIAPVTLQGSRTGVFVGMCAYDYSYLLMREPDLNAYMGSGSAHSVASGRLSYVLGLQGPSMALDTACSSALVALHLACQSLRAGECRLALASAANLVLIPEPVIMFSKAHMLAPDGRCKTFDALADGYVRSEGCGTVVLKRYSDALRDGDRVLALIRGSAVNQDGRSSGLTAPNGPAQEAVIREALAHSGKSASEIDYIETHGTGTPLGDPIEVQAFGRVYGEGRDAAHPLLAGSVKTNVGHLEAAAGMASLIKTVLAIGHSAVPPHLHLRNANPRIPWDSLPVRVPCELTAWPERGHPRTAGISSFGFSGTNAHVIVEQAPEIPEAASEWVRPLHILCVSARTAPALTQLASRYQDHLSTHPAEPFGDICFTANTGRSHFAHRLTLIAADSKQAQSRLAAFQSGRGHEGVATGITEDGVRREVTFLFTGQGSQYIGMGRRLFQTQPVFRAALLRCEELFRPHLPCALTEVLFGGDSRIDETVFTQPALFALQYGLTELWRSWGIVPDAVIGHSVGEYAAACAAGALAVEDAVTLIAARSRLMQALRERGSMAAVVASEEQVAAALRSYAGRVVIAAVNGADHIVISGQSDAVQKVIGELTAAGIHTQPLAVSHAFHSPLMEPMLDEFENVAATLRFAAPTIPLVSNLSGAFVVPGEIEQPNYWRRHIRQTVQFARGMDALHANGHALFLEIGPSPTLLGMGRRCLPGAELTWLPSLRKTRDEWEQMLETAAALYIRGAHLDWAGFDQGYARRKCGLPTYPFQRERFWVTGGGTAEIAAPLEPVHPLLGRRLRSPLSQVQFEAVIGAYHPPLLQDHKVYGAVVFPGAAYMEGALCAASEALPTTAVAIEGVDFHQMLSLRDDCQTRLQLILDSEPGKAAAIPFRFLSQTNDETEWTCHASGTLSPLNASAPARVAIADLKARCTKEIDVASYYASLRDRGLEYGPAFHCLRGLWRGAQEALARIACAPDVYQLHPALLDSGFQAVGALLSPDEADGNIHIPIALDTLRFFRRTGEHIWCHIELRPANGSDSEIVSADLRLLDDDGELLAHIEGLHLKRIGASALERSGKTATRDCFYEVEWRALDREAARGAAADGAWLIVSDSSPLPQELARELNDRGESCHVADFAEQESSAKLRGVIYFAPAHEAQTCAGLLQLLQGLATHRDANPPRLCIVTRGADAVLGPPVLDHTPIAGMARVIALEHPELRTLRIDLDASSAANAMRQIAEELHAEPGEGEVAFRNGARYVPRLVRSRFTSGEAGPWRLEKSGGLIDALSLQPRARQAPGPGEVEIRVRAAGLNFRDVLNALDTYPGDAGPLGCECAGEIVAVGPGVQTLAVGDEVIAFAPGCFGTLAVTGGELAARKPSSLTWEQACSVPIAFLTAHYALQVLGGIRPGQRVLIHAAAGGVGLAAVQLAQRAGAEIFATAGSDEKRAHLRGLGVQHIMDSRSLAFSGEIREATGGAGVDLVLNSLSGEFIPHSLSVLKAGGQFLEIGKAGIWDTKRVAEFRPDVRYHVIALDALALQDPAHVGAMLRDVIAQVESGQLHPLPTRTFALDDAVAAFRYMAQAKHTGKVVIAMSGVFFSPDATYLIAGGTGGLGLVTAGWMADCGAKNLLLISRSAASEEAEKELGSLAQRGVRIVRARADISHRDQLAGALDRALADMPPLRGVVHAAGILDDGMLAQQTAERFATVLSPKMKGAWNLHGLTAKAPLDFFVLFSSIASLFGSPGQASYAAGNAFVDALAHFRRAQGRPAVSINWGPWSEVGLAARRKLDLSMSKLGLTPFAPAQAKQLLNELFGSTRAQIAAISVKWPAFLRQYGAGAAAPFFSALSRRGPSSASEPVAPRIFAQLEGASPARRREMLREHVHEVTRKVLGLDRLDDRQRLLETGMDSLMAVELRNLLQQSLGRALPTTIVFEHPTVAALTAFLHSQLFPQVPADARPARAVVDPFEHIDELSDSSLAALLESKLAAIESQETK